MHRFTWDMHYDPIPGAATGGRGGGGGANGAVPHRTYPGINSPWVAPGAYTVRLTVNGKAYTQPITIKLDPRVKITPEVEQIFTLTTRVENHVRAAAAAYKDARVLLEKVKGNEALTKQIEEIAPAEPVRGEGGGRGGRGGRGGSPEPATPANLADIGARMVASIMPMQASEMPPTATELKTAADQQAAYTTLMAKWTAIKAKASGGTSKAK